MSRPLRIGIVANEPSGDQLGAGLIQAIRTRYPDARFHGVCGPGMSAQGCTSLVPMERLSVMGLVEVVRHIPGLLAIRRRLVKHFLNQPPDLFVGIDAPDFNLGLETRLRRGGIPTVHYVSPTVWAWRPRRVAKIRRAADLVLNLFPFESDFLQRHGVSNCYVGHPLAQDIPLEPDVEGARRRLGLRLDQQVIAILPGSRVGEVQALSPAFLGAAHWCLQRHPQLRFLTPLVNSRVRAVYEQALADFGHALPLTLVDGNSRDVLSASDLVLTASGTATFEALLHQRPMVVGYRLNALTYGIVKGLDLLKVEHVALANLLVGEELAPELIQHQCRADRLGEALLALLEDPGRCERIRERYGRLHRDLCMDSNARAADAALTLIDDIQ